MVPQLSLAAKFLVPTPSLPSKMNGAYCVADMEKLLVRSALSKVSAAALLFGNLGLEHVEAARAAVEAHVDAYLEVATQQQQQQ